MIDGAYALENASLLANETADVGDGGVYVATPVEV